MSETMTTRAESLPGFDYSVLDEETAYQLQAITQCVVELHQSFAFGMAQQVGKAHDLLCGGGSCKTVLQLHKANGNRGEATFTAWCEYIGLNRQTAYNLLKAYRLICDATPEERTHLMGAPARLLYAAGSPSAPAELVQAVKDGDITSHKQYQELLAKYKAERERADALGAEVLDRDAQISQLADSCQQAETARDAAEAKARRAQEIKDVALDEVKAARAAQAEAMAEVRRVRSDLELADRKAEGYKQQVAELDQEASEMQDALDEARIENESLKAAMAAAPVAPAVVDQDEVDRRVREGVAAALADEEARWAEAVEAQQTAIRRLKETAGLAGQIKAAGEAVTAVLESLLARLDPAELDGPAVRALDGLSDTLDRYAGRLYDAVEVDEQDEELEED